MTINSTSIDQETYTQMTINATELIGDGFPTDEGKRLGTSLLESLKTLETVEVDLTGCKPVLLISAFFNAVLQTVYDRDPKLLGSARKIKWNLPFEFQRQNVAQWMVDFRPDDS